MKAFLLANEHIIFSVAIILATVVLATVFNFFYRKLIFKKSNDLNNDPTNYKFLGHSITALIYIVGIGAAIFVIPSLKALATSLLAGAGILAVVIGFASQQALSNIVAGIFIIMFKPFRINDRITIQANYSGIVEDITLRHTVIRNFENRRIIIPNSIISNEIVVNADFNDDKVCKFIEFGISYDSNIDKAKAIIKEEIFKHPNFLDARTPEQIEENEEVIPIRVIALADSSVNLRAWAWAKDSPHGFVLQCDILEIVKKRFDKENIEIPFPHRTIVQKQTK